VLYADASPGASGFAHTNLMDRLQSGGSEAQVVVLFDAWDEAPLPAFLARLREAVASIAPEPMQVQAPVPGLVAATLIAWQQALNVSFLIVFDRFERHLGLPEELDGIRAFDEELVKMLNAPALRANFVLVMNEHAAPLLSRLRDRVPGFGDTAVHLPASGPRSTPSDAAERHVVQETTAPIFHGSTRAPAYSGSPDTPADHDAPGESSTPEEWSAPPASRAATTTRSGFSGTGARAAVVTRVTTLHDAAEPVPSEVPAEYAEPIASAPLSEASIAHDPLQKSAWLPRAATAVLLIALSCLLLLALWEPAHHTPPARQNAQSAPTPQLNEAPDSTAEGIWSPADDQTPFRQQAAATEPEDSIDSSVRAATPGQVTAPAVYIHARNEAQRARAEQMVEALAKKGIRVSGIKVVPAGPNRSDVRYFRSEEADEAAQVLRALRDVGLSVDGPKRIAGLESTAPPRQYELWLAPSAQ
jgi:hypothetical protein